MAFLKSPSSGCIARPGARNTKEGARWLTSAGFTVRSRQIMATEGVGRIRWMGRLRDRH